MSEFAPLTTSPLIATCRSCQKPLGRQNRSGFCRSHVSAFNLSKPDVRERQRAGIKRRHDNDPEFLEGLRQRARALASDPEINARRTQHFKDNRYWELGLAVSRQPEVRARAGRASSATKMAWCPPEYRDDYRYLIRTKRIPAAEARQIILSTVETDARRYAATGVLPQSTRAEGARG